ncbi:hypothetical protein C7417_2005 [Cupriavidus plantarum]|nr:hypothetical protein C7417_2005 [Cupriavidus plantarum]
MANTADGHPTRRIVPAGSVTGPAPTFPASVFHLAATMSSEPAAMETEATSSRNQDVATESSAPAALISKVDRAVAYVEQYGEASRTELAAAMGLESPSHVKSFLKTPLADGRLTCDGDRFMIGTGKPLAAKPRRTAALTPAAAEHATEPAQMQGVNIDKPHAVIATPTAQVLLNGLGITVRTDGSLRITANGKTVDLDPTQARLMRDFAELLGRHGVSASGLAVAAPSKSTTDPADAREGALA